MAVLRGAMAVLVVVLKNARAASIRCIVSSRRWRYCCCEVAALFCCVFASMALSVRRSVLRREVALPCCTSSGACLWLWAVLVHSSQRDMSKTSASAFFVKSLRGAHAICCARSRVELRHVKALAHPQIASACDIRPRHCLAGVDTPRTYGLKPSISRVPGRGRLSHPVAISSHRVFV